MSRTAPEPTALSTSLHRVAAFMSGWVLGLAVMVLAWAIIVARS
jgi:hypothetical protein